MSASTEEPRSIYIDQRASPRTTATATAHTGSCEQSASRFCRNGICLSLLLLMARLSSKLLPASTALAVVILCLAMPSCKGDSATNNEPTRQRIQELHASCRIYCVFSNCNLQKAYLLFLFFFGANSTRCSPDRSKSSPVL